MSDMWILLTIAVLWNLFFGGFALYFYIQDKRRWASMVEVPGLVSFRQVLGGPRDVVLHFQTAEGREIEMVPRYRGNELQITRYLREGTRVRVFYHPHRPDEPWLTEENGAKWISFPLVRAYFTNALLLPNFAIMVFLILDLMGY
ncbi:hypothetical protein GCM10010517_57600 [Streptosporangium fragile]|uniref:DUF3592 domain-containing protein n=1 Tax=Streptosporangium fragile TaxID=46186 RepID=A0ABN3W4N5_9ACTN